MQFGRALAFPFEDDNWFKKVLLPAAFLIIPILGMLVTTGWSLEICRRVIRNRTAALPDMEFRRNLTDGLSVWGIMLICLIPFGLWLGLGGIAGSLMGAAKEAAGDYDLIWWGIECVALVLALAAAVWITAAIGRLADTGTFRSAFMIREVFSAIRSAPAVFIIATLSWIPLGLLAVSGTAICCVGAFFTSAFAAASAFHLAGQAYSLAAAKPVPPAA